MILLKNITVSRGDKLLLNETSCQIDVRQKIALVGKNGCGKSSLFAVLMGQLEFSRGEVELPRKLTIAHLEQETPARQTTALDHVLAAHEVFAEIESVRRAAEADGNYELVAECYQKLEEIQGFELSAKAAKLLQGLGFDEAMQQKTVAEFSGGWRMRINLARCLFKPADLLLLDEPTNYLELESIVWLERWLQQSPATIVLISHDRLFIDNVATHVIHLHQKKLQMYTGNYSQFEKLHYQQMMLQQVQFEKQQKKIAHMMDFVNRFRAKASKAKQAQSRLRAIEKLELVAGIQSAGAFSFNIQPAPTVSNPIIKLDDANIGYGDKIILNQVKLSLLAGTRVGLLGVNGAGKSTLLKTLMGKLPLVNGECFTSSNAKIGYFAQHQIDDLPLDENLLQYFREAFPGTREQNIRSYLGSYMFTGDQVHHQLGLFSGGEKSRIALAKLFWEPKNLIILDEPTNHLDMEMREALMLGLQDFQGTLILVSHDRFLLESLVDEFYLVADHQVSRFDGDIEDYQQWYWQQQTLNEKTKKNMNNKASDNKIKLPTNSEQVKNLEKEIEKTQKQINTIQAAMTNPSYYAEDNKAQASQDHSQLQILKNKLSELEQQWYQCNEGT